MTPPHPLVVLDTSVISELMRPNPAADVESWVGRQVPEATATTSVTVAEVRFGLQRLPAGRRRALLVRLADDVFTLFQGRVLPFDEAAAGHYADIAARRERAGAPISGFDAQIAAVCRSRRAVLATRDTDGFADVGLDLTNPWLPGT